MNKILKTRLKLRHELEAPPWMRQFGSGWISGVLGFVLGVAALLGWFNNPDAHMLPLVLGTILLVLLLLLLLLAAAAVWLLGKDFMAPIMAVENLDFADAWSHLLVMMKREKGAYAGYIGMKIVLAIAAGILVGIVIFVAILFIALPFGIAGAIALIAGKTAGLTWTVETVTLAIVVGTIFLAALMVVSSLLSVPLSVYFPAYSIYFFASRYPPLNAVLYPAPPLIVAAPPPEPPPLPPMPEPIG